MTETKDKIIIQSEVDNFFRYFLIVGVLFFSWLCYLTKSAILEEPIDLIVLTIFLCFLGFALWSLIGFWAYYDNIKIFSDRLEVKNFGGLYHKTIYFSEISRIQTIHKKGEYNSWDELIIRYGNNQKYKIYSTSYSNYYKIDVFLSNKRGRNIKGSGIAKNKHKSQNYDRIIVIIMLLIGLYGIFYFYKQSNDYQIDRDELVSVELTLDSKPSIVKGSKGSSSLVMSIKEYPDFNFNISGAAYSATNTSNFIENTEGGSRIVLTIDKEDYWQKLIKSKEITFWKKHFDYRHISIYGIKDSKQAYLTISSYEEENKSDSKWGYWGIIVIIIFIAYEVRDNQKKKK